MSDLYDAEILMLAMAAHDEWADDHRDNRMRSEAILDAAAPLIAAKALRDYTDDLADRLERARQTLTTRSRDADGSERFRLDGKANGVALALSYVNERQRSLAVEIERS